MADMSTNQDDHAFRILEHAPLGMSVKADCWDAFYEATSAKDLSARLEHFDIPDAVRVALVSARKSIDPSQRDRVMDAIHQLSKIDPKVLETAEKFPTVLQHLLDATKKDTDEQD
jgi:hypothetical protein